MSKMLFVLNPIAGGGRAKDLEDLIDKSMKKYDMEYDIVLTTQPQEATDIVSKCENENVVAVGGDGTINEVAKGIIKRGYGTLGIIPGGTGNDLSRSLDISLDPEEALEQLMNNDSKKLNVCMANDYYFLNISSIGFDAEIVDNASKIKHIIKGHMAYLLSLFYTLGVYKKKKVNIEIDGKEEDIDLVLLAVGNGIFYGGGIPILPQSDFSDGYLHSCIVRDVSKPKLMVLFPSIFRRNHFKYKKYVRAIKAKEITIRSEEDMYFNLDGEILNGGKEIDFKVNDYQLPVIYPN